MNTVSLLRLSSPPALYLIKWSHLLSSGLALEHFIKKDQSTKEKLLLLPTWKIKTSDDAQGSFPLLARLLLLSEHKLLLMPNPFSKRRLASLARGPAACGGVFRVCTRAFLLGHHTAYFAELLALLA